MALFVDLVVPLLEADGALILGERQHLVLELLDRDVRIDRSLLHCFDHVVQVAQLRLEPGW